MGANDAAVVGNGDGGLLGVQGYLSHGGQSSSASASASMRVPTVGSDAVEQARPSGVGAQDDAPMTDPPGR